MRRARAAALQSRTVLYQATRPPERDLGAISGTDDEDQRAVAGLYKEMRDFVASCAGAMQVIVTDHVELLQPWFRECLVERWRDGVALVPDDWAE